jgi:Cu+-exporting ATPase
VDTIVLDKTGTLTEGRPRVTQAEISNDDLRLVAALERRSEHPLARAVWQFAETRALTVPDVEDFRGETGRGVEACVEGHRVLAGNQAFLEEHGVGSSPGGILVAVDGKFAGTLMVADPLRAGAKEVIRDFQRMGLEVVLLSGDRIETAQAIASEAGITRVIAGVLPAGKVAAIHRLQDEGRIVAMVGDGINDAPALAQADVGFAMGSGTDVAIAAGDVTLLHADLNGVARAIALSRAAWKIMRQNLGWALGYNVIAIPLAAFGVLSPVIASAAMALSSVSVVSNSLRLKRIRL